MGFAIGDKVETIDDNLTGIVTKITGNVISIETDFGFELDFKAHELVKIENNQLLKKVSTADVKHKISSETQNTKRRVVKKKEKKEPPMQVDLHIEKLVKSTKGMTNHDILTYQIETAKRKLEFAIQNNIKRVVFIHGVGEGVLKMELEYLLGRYNVSFYDADFKTYGFGATEVYIYQNN